MVRIQLDLSEEQSKKLKIYTTFKNLKDQRLGIKLMIDELKLDIKTK